MSGPSGRMTGMPDEFDAMPWASLGACVGKDPALWFPPKGGNSRSFGEAGKAICAECPVRVECLMYAYRTDQMYGVWGGLDTAERNAELPKRRLR